MLLLFIVLFSVYLILEYDPIRSGKTTIAFVLALLIFFASTWSTDVDTLLQSGEVKAKLIGLVGAVFFGKLVYGIYRSIRQQKSRQRYQIDEHYPELFKKRKRDLQRLKKLFEAVDIVGINASWGMGKTFLLSYFKREPDISRQYYVVEISVLTCKVDQLIPVLFHDLDQVLKKDGILSLQSESVKVLCDSQKGIRSIINIIFGSTEGSAQALLAFKKNLECMHKKVVIIYEDLDRVDDVKIIKQILSINLLLSSPRIKIIYQYDDERMKQLGIGMDYLEKYIPHHMKLTELDSEEIIMMNLDELKVDEHILARSDLMILSRGEILEIVLQEHYDWYDSPVQSMLAIAEYTPRNIKFWIEEILIFLSTYSFYREADNKKLLIRLLYLKHILPDYYDKISSFDAISQILLLEREDSMQSLDDPEKKEAFISDEHNKECVAILDFLGYQLHPLVRRETDPEIRKHRENEKREEDNFRLDRIYHHIIMAGGHPQTNRETILTKIKKEVLSKDDVDEQYRAWKEIVGQSYYLNQHIDGYTTINYVGHSYFEDTLDAAFLVPFTEEEECKFLRLFEAKRRNSGALDLEYIRVVLHASMNKNAVFSLIVSQMAHFKVIGNFLSGGSEGSFNNFMYIFSLACRKLQYITYSDYDFVQLESDLKHKYLAFLEAVKKRTDFLEETIDTSDQPRIKELFSNLRLACDCLADSVQDERAIRYDPVRVSFSSVSEQGKELEQLLSKKKEVSNDPAAKKHFKEEVLRARENGQLDWDGVCKILSDKIE